MKDEISKPKSRFFRLRGRPIQRRHQLAFVIGLVFSTFNLILMIGLLTNLLSDTYFLVLAGTAPWSIALLGIGMIPPKDIHDMKWTD